MSIGGNGVWKHGTHGATTSLTDFSGKMREFSESNDTAEVNATVWGDGFEQYEPSFLSGTFTLKYKYDDTLYLQLMQIQQGRDTISFEYGPTGSTTGKPKSTGSIIFTKVDKSNNVGQLMEISVNARVTGARTFTTYS